MPKVPQAGTIPAEEIDRILDASLVRPLTQGEVETLRIVTTTFRHVTDQLREKIVTVARLRRFLGMKSSEKTADVLPAQGGAATPPVAPEVSPAAAAAEPDASGPGAAAASAPPANEKPKAKGHGRIPVSAYPNVPCLSVLHESLRPGETCPRCGKGRLYELEPARVLRIVGQPPLAALRWDCQRLRCATCGDVFTAHIPESALPKYDETAVAMMALLRYRAGMPLHRLDHLERNLATPVPASTQWDLVNQHVAEVRPIFDELGRLAAQGEVVHNDDSYARILAFMGKRRAALLAKGQLADPDRTGIFTTAIVSIVESKPIALFFTGRKHAGENLTDLLVQRTNGRVPLLMSDALNRNVPTGRAVVEANCLAHGRRHIVDEVENFPQECARLLGMLRQVFRIDARCRHFKLSPEQRLVVHQCWSGPVMGKLRAWIIVLFAEKQIEPNSGLGKAMNYLLKRWDKFTRFLFVAGAPIDNNICERALKMTIRHRRNSLFYRSQKGANVGDLFMTLIHTAELHGANPFDYLTALLRHAKAAQQCPADWLPWTYRETLTRQTAPNTCASDPTRRGTGPPPGRPAVPLPLPIPPAAPVRLGVQLSN